MSAHQDRSRSGCSLVSVRSSEVSSRCRPSESRVDAVVENGEALFLEIEPGLDQRARGETLERRRAPDVERVSQGRPGARPVVSAECVAAPRRGGAEDLQVELFGVDLERVAASPCDDALTASVGCGNGAAQARDVDRDGVACRRWWEFPDRMHEGVPRDRASPVKHQRGHDRPGVLPAEPHRPSVADDLDRPEHPKLHRNPFAAFPQRRSMHRSAQSHQSPR